ncbi:MAG: hypothetical protein GX842_07875 [Spirochaetales bacterium]|nr:hypothetical protein [Spirochaetales bacterium]
MRMKIMVKRDGSIVYSLTPFYKIVYGLFCLILVVGFFSVRGEGPLGASIIIPLLLFIISLGGAGYRESWHFTPPTGEIVYKVGFFFWVKASRYSRDEVKRITITHFVRGRTIEDPRLRGRGRNRSMVIFSLQFSDDSTKDIEIITERASGGATEGAARKIATAMNIPYWQDRQSER